MVVKEKMGIAKITGAVTNIYSNDDESFWVEGTKGKLRVSLYQAKKFAEKSPEGTTQKLFRLDDRLEDEFQIVLDKGTIDSIVTKLGPDEIWVGERSQSGGLVFKKQKPKNPLSRGERLDWTVREFEVPAWEEAKKGMLPLLTDHEYNLVLNRTRGYKSVRDLGPRLCSLRSKVSTYASGLRPVFVDMDPDISSTGARVIYDKVGRVIETLFPE